MTEPLLTDNKSGDSVLSPKLKNSSNVSKKKKVAAKHVELQHGPHIHIGGFRAQGDVWREILRGR